MDKSVLVFTSASKDKDAQDIYFDTTNRKFYKHKRISVGNSILAQILSVVPALIGVPLRVYDATYISTIGRPMHYVLAVLMLGIGFVYLSYMRKAYLIKVDKARNEFQEYFLQECDIKYFVWEEKDNLSDYLMREYIVALYFILVLLKSLIFGEISFLIVSASFFICWVNFACIYPNRGKQEKVFLSKIADQYQVYK